MNLVFDFGNTYQKMAVMSLGEVIVFVKKSKIGKRDIELFFKKYNPSQAILSSVIDKTEAIEDFVKNKIPFLKFSNKTPIPIENEYKSPQTLGADRLACAVAAQSLFLGQPVLVIQMGTCITSDFITKSGIYKGGSISPGLQMRLNSFNHFSAKLPLVKYKNTEQITGTTTEESILVGVIRGIEDECIGIINRYINAFDNLKIILTGGDAKLFENRIKNEIFAIDNLVLIGLNIILNYNAEN